jgi:phosphatidate cytidylyltransferase
LAFNIQTFKTRALTALLFVTVMLVGLLWNFWSFLILFTVIHFGCWFECVKLMKKIYAEKYLGYCLFGLVYITMPILMLVNFYTDAIYNLNYSMDCLIWPKPVYTHASHLPLIAVKPVFIIFSIWINDTMAYLVGSFIGKTPLTKISPKKTWEGTIGGVIITIVVAGIVSMLVWHQLYWPWIFIAGISAIFGTLGDLFESKLKRMAGVKDSGSFMPGHGGFLDRFDSLLGATPFVWLYVKLFV